MNTLFEWKLPSMTKHIYNISWLKYFEILKK
jgi:hypothetical protein